MQYELNKIVYSGSPRKIDGNKFVQSATGFVSIAGDPYNLTKAFPLNNIEFSGNDTADSIAAKIKTTAEEYIKNNFPNT